MVSRTPVTTKNGCTPDDEFDSRKIKNTFADQLLFGEINEGGDEITVERIDGEIAIRHLVNSY